MPVNSKLVTQWSRGRIAGLVEYDVCQRLRNLASQVPNDQLIVELGAFKGRSTSWLLLGSQEGNNAHVVSIDPWTLHQTKSVKDRLTIKYGNPNVYSAYKRNMKRIGADNKSLSTIRGYADRVANSWNRGSVGLLWHDAEHYADDVERDLRAWLPHLSDDATIVLHDAGRPDGEVVEGARRVLDTSEWDWNSRELILWEKHPDNRGALIVNRVKRDTRDSDHSVLSVPEDNSPSGYVNPGTVFSGFNLSGSE